MQATPATKVHFAEHLLGEPLGPWVKKHREDDRSWQWIANRIHRETDGRVTFSRQWLRHLFGGEAADQRRAS